MQNGRGIQKRSKKAFSSLRWRKLPRYDCRNVFRLIYKGNRLSDNFGYFEDFVHKHKDSRVLYLELGVGSNTPVIIKYPFWRFTSQNPNATYACINYGEATCPYQIADRAIMINADIGEALSALKCEK